MAPRATGRFDRGFIVPGLVAGLVGGLAMALVSLALRAAFGVPHPVELASDRIIPLLSIERFSLLARLLGGLEGGRIVAVLSTIGLQVLLGGAGGVVYHAARERAGRGSAARGARHVSGAVLGSLLLVVWVVGVALLWPALASNYRGVPPGPARLGSALGLLLSFAAYGGVVVLVHRALGSPRPERATSSDEGTRGVPPVTRRTLLVGGVAVLLAAASGGLIRSLYRRATIGAFGYDGLRVRGPHTDPITPNDLFYVVTKNIVDPDIDRDRWRLEVTGQVRRPQRYTYEELRSLPSVGQTTTLECISNSVGGGLMSNARWRGVPLGFLIDRAGPLPGSTSLLLHAADGYTHSVPVDRAMSETVLVAYEMNDAPLPPRHGYPARALVPGAYGEVSVKWLDRIEVLDHTAEGYYERQGWRAGVVVTTARIDRPSKNERMSLASNPRVSLGGVAYAGDRGVSSVEFSIDAGRTWSPAGIDYRESALSWIVWSADWAPEGPGRHELTVRATDGLGVLQPAAERPVAPAGASGYHRIIVHIEP
jgi:DMSO/TMAO reductase YedYZ molybdopterin-dependent catalytic subunit